MINFSGIFTHPWLFRKVRVHLGVGILGNYGEITHFLSKVRETNK